MKMMKSIIHGCVIICLTVVLLAEVVQTIYDPSVTTTKPPKRRESLPWYLAGENAEPPADFLIPPEQPRTFGSPTKTRNSWGKYPTSQIDKYDELGQSYHHATSVGQEQYQENEALLFTGKQETHGDVQFENFNEPPPRWRLEGKNKLPAGESLYEGDRDDENKPRRETIMIHNDGESLIIARYDKQRGIECPYPDATGQFVYPLDCKFFVNCWKGRAFVQPCAPGTQFNPETLECDFPHKVKCYGGELADFTAADYTTTSAHREPTMRKYSLASAALNNNYHPKCPEHINGLLPHPTDCTKFLQCANGGTIIENCGPGTVFNSIISVCDHPRNVRGCEDVYTIDDSLRPLPHSSRTQEISSNQNTWRPIAVRQEIRPSCPGDFTGMLAHPSDCKKFLQCDRGATFIMDCGPGTAFNPSISVCDWPYNVPGCEDHPTPVYGSATYGHESWQGTHSQNEQHQHSNNREHRRYDGTSFDGNYHQQFPEADSPAHHQPHHHQHHRHHQNSEDRLNVPKYNPTDGTQQYVPSANSRQNQWQEPPTGHRPSNNPSPPPYPHYPPRGREPSGHTKHKLPYPGGDNIDSNGNIYGDGGYFGQGGINVEDKGARGVYKHDGWKVNSGPYGNINGHSSDKPKPQTRPPIPWPGDYPGRQYDRQPALSVSNEGKVTSLDDKLDSWQGKPKIIEQADKAIDQDTKLDAWASKTNIFNQGKYHSDQTKTNNDSPSNIYVNRNGIKGHYIVKEIEINQNHSNTRHYTPSATKIPEIHSSIYNEADNSEGSSHWKPSNHAHPSNYSNNRFNSSRQRWKPIKFYNKTQANANNNFNQSHVLWKPENKTTFNPHNSLRPIYIEATDNASTHYFTNGGDSATASTIRRGEIVPNHSIPTWAKPDTYAPSVSIDDDIDDENHTEKDEDNKYDDDVDVLDETDSWKPRLAIENKTKKHDNSVIMSVNRKTVDIDIFNIESAPWQEQEIPFPVYYIPPVYSLGDPENSQFITPSSGQILRLRGGTSAYEGYVEVQGVQPGWGVVCDEKNSWTLKEANIVCRQLGYLRGAETAWQGRPKSEKIPSWTAATRVHCQGNETKFQTCKFVHESNCNIQRDAVGVSCLPNRVAYCHKDEIPHGGNCYHLANSSSGLNHAEALNYCTSKNARLVDITTQMENDFLSEWLLQNYPHVESIMTSGIGFTTFNRSVWLWEDSAKAKFKFSKWWPGWKEDKKLPPWAGNRPVCIIMKKKFPCYNRPDTNCLADYFFWDTEDCAASMKGHSYICKRPYDDISCIYGKGHQYSGNANVTESGKSCLPWNHESVAYPLIVTVPDREVRRKLKSHNFCRNPNPMEESRPWCFTGPYGQQEHCDIPSCGNIGTIRSPAGGQCKKGHFECMPEECIPSHWVCDGEEDCTNGRDENFCSQHLEFFKRTPGHRLEGSDVVKWLNTPRQTCALRCKEAEFTCRSFSHKINGNLCLLSDNNIGTSGALKSDVEFDYYEMKALSIDCTGMFICTNQKCINRTQVCDGKNDCKDRSDESICTVENLDYSIRLAGSENTHEGRVEVKILGEWGQVCDDGFGMIDAEVVCKEVGFSLGALEVRPGGFFGNLEPRTRFMVDQLKCRGNETSLRECDFDGWGVHDCSPEEAVGVVCKTAVNTCQEGHWKCDNSPTCIPTPFICDEVVDCPDRSDESKEHCEAPFEMRLANGSGPFEGRVEVRHHGVWGTVCDDDFSHAAAKVICRALGYAGRAKAKKNGYFGPGEGPIWLDEVFCHGNETQLYRCEHSHWGLSNCNHEEDAGVICQDGPVSNDEDDERTQPVININDILPDNCGKRAEDFDGEDDIFQRVVRGSVAPKDSYPWQASIRVRGHSRSNHWCGAVIISPRHILTAAHCLEGYNKGTYFVRAGDYNTEIKEGTEAEANIEDYYIHEGFRKGQRMNNDIALVLLKGRGIPLGEHIMPICLPPSNAEYPQGLNCTISGFGSIQTGQSAHSRDLRFGWVPLIDQSVCRADYVYGEGAISEGMLCAGYLDEGVDSCDGDSGGPLACQHNGAFTLYGITSWGQHCGKANKPGVYVRIAHYRDWIDEKIRDSISGR